MGKMMFKKHKKGGYKPILMENPPMKKIIKDAPSVIPQVPSEDCISRVRVLRYIADVQLTVSDDKKQRAVCDWLFDGIEEMPSVIPSVDNLSAVGEGEWIFKRSLSD